MVYHQTQAKSSIYPQTVISSIDTSRLVCVIALIGEKKTLYKNKKLSLLIVPFRNSVVIILLWSVLIE